MTKEKVSLLLTYLLFLTLILSTSYLLVENTRLQHDKEQLQVSLSKAQTELVDSQNQAYGYKWQLEQINRDEGWNLDE